MDSIKIQAKNKNTPDNISQGEPQREYPDDSDAAPVRLLNNTTSMKRTIFIMYLVLVLFGIGTGFVLANEYKSTTQMTDGPATMGTVDIQNPSVNKTFPDSAVGVVQKGNIKTEGTHTLIREGGESQTASLVSTVVDLDQYIDKKVKVWGQTMGAKKASWLMDVGKVDIIQ